jgi:acetoin utilization deacetylase AcuC-like enzyme
VSTLFVTHPACERHQTGRGHPERPQRLTAVSRAVESAGLVDHLTPLDAPEVDRGLLETVHARRYIGAIENLARGGGGWLDADTAVSVDSPAAALRAAGGAQYAAEAVCAAQAPRALRARRAFVAVRPPGHHALPDRGMGFCLFNNVAVAAAAARRAGRERVMIVDWDVHHGNGTQAIFWRDPSVLFVSMHQEYWYPGTGEIEEVGEGPGEGHTVNVPLPAGTGDGGYMDVFTEIVLPLFSVFHPDMLVVSAGYDAHESDPLGGMVLTSAGFGRLARVLDGAARATGTPLVAVLEGGYDLPALGASVVATLEALTGRAADAGLPPGEAPAEMSAMAIAARVRAVRRVALTHWRI